MEKSKASPIVRFKEDPIHSLIMETLSKKPVNSDYFSLVKRIKINDYIKKPISSDKLETISQRSKDYMTQVGFAYGRLTDKNWVSTQAKDEKLRIHAPGPVIRKPSDEETEEFEIPDTFKSKKMTGFQKVKRAETPEVTLVHKQHTRVLTTRPTTRLLASKNQTRENLVYLNTLTPSEQSFINFQVAQKKREFSQQFGENAKKSEESLNARGIFSAEFNRERAQSMIPVKMMNKVRVCIQPMMRFAKEVAIKEKAMKGLGEVEKLTKEKSIDLDSSAKKEKLIEMIEGTITKKQVRNRRKEGSWNTRQQKVKVHWAERLNTSMRELINKTKLDEKDYNMQVL